MSVVRRLLWVWLLIPAAGCGLTTDGGSADASTVGNGPPIVSFGNSGPSEGHEETLDGAEVDVVFGPQGGWHIWGSIRIENMDPQGMFARFELKRNGSEVVGDSSGRNIPLRQKDPGVFEAVGITMFIADGVDPRGWERDTPVHVKATFKDRRNKEVVVERDWKATCCVTQQ